MNLKNTPIGQDAPNIVNAIIEIPKGGRVKFEYDVNLQIFKLDRVLHSAVHYPAAYGFIPQTLYGDGDPLDCLILVSEPLFTGCLLRMRPIAVLKTRDDKGSDDKVLGVAIDDPRYIDVHELKDLPKHVPLEIENFFMNYKQLEKKKVESFGWGSREEAAAAIKEGINGFKS